MIYAPNIPMRMKIIFKFLGTPLGAQVHILTTKDNVSQKYA